jgi:hypothetical protein
MFIVGALAYGQSPRTETSPPLQLQDDEHAAAGRAATMENGLPYVADKAPAPITISTLPYGPKSQPAVVDDSTTHSRPMPATHHIRRVHDVEVIPEKPQPMPQHEMPEGASGCMGHEPVIQADECGQAGGCGPFAWFNAEWLHWRVRGPQQPPLLNLIAQAPCACGNVDAVTIDGGGTRNMGWFDGARASAGIWLSDCWGAEFDYMALASKTITSAFTSDGGFLLGIPFIDSTGAENNAIIMCPQEIGSFRSQSTTRLWGFETNLVRSGCDSCNWGCNWILGFRYLQLAESLDIVNQAHVFRVGCGMPVGSDISLWDDFGTANHFFGPQIGARCDWQSCRCVSMNASAKLALGAVDEIVRIQGVSSCSCGGPAVVTNGGFFAQPTNIGSYRHADFCVVPEVRAGIDLKLTCRVHLNLGYSFLYMSEVVRPGDQIDRHVNLTQLAGGALVGPASPHFDRQTTDFFAHGLDLGLEFRF